ncbi:MAG TPA: PilZ domain-containing protein [Steroidobacteraceae bacterium]|jgi:hypothetical protein|nr:PilZ domain-containing protein [Steroidobacteraceae bacterium]
MNTEPATQGRVRHPAFMEHRWGQRVTLGLPVHVTAGHTSAIGVLRDASVSGGFIESVLDPAIFTNLGVIVLVGHGETRRAVELPCNVTRRDPDGFGVEWRDMACAPLLALLRETGTEFARLTARDRVFS